MKFSLKSKILAVIISLSVIGLSVFAYLTHKTYQQDKQAFIYDQLTSETLAKSRLFAVVTDDYNLLLSTIISRIDSSSKDIPESLMNFLEGDQSKVLGIYYHIPGDEIHSYATVFEPKDKTGKWTWEKLDIAPMGLSLIDTREGFFVLKKPIGNNAYAAIVFKQLEMWNSLKTANGKISFAFSKDKILSKSVIDMISAEDLRILKTKIKETPGLSGLFVEQFSEDSYYVTYAKLGASELTLISLVSEKKVHLVQSVFLKQVTTFLILMASISLLIGTLAARWLTWRIDKLTKAATELEGGNFEVQVEVTSGDEIGSLGNAFNSMGSRIKNLLEDLRIYNLELESKVAERTRELKELSDIQKGMLNALGQGFVIINKENKILPIYSKVAQEMFEVVPDEVPPTTVMGVPEENTQSVNELMEMAFNKILEFDDVSRLAPDLRTNSKNQRIQLTYAPIMNEYEDGFDYVMVVGTDKTLEFENMEKFKREWNFSQMIYKIASNKFSFNKLLSESLHMLDSCFHILDIETPYGVRDVQRLIHTIKGNFSYFNITDIFQSCHNLESYLQSYYDTAECPDDVRYKVLDDLKDIHTLINNFIDQYDSIIQYKQSATTRIVPLKDLKDFSTDLKKRDPELEKLFQARIFKTPVQPFFQLYEPLIKELGAKLGKDVRFNIIGGDTEIPDGPWDNLFQQFVHFVRNSVDHGIEKAEDRAAAGKTLEGHITFEFKIGEFKGEKCLIAILGDDGAGINWKKIAAKDPTVTCLEDAIERIKTGGISSKDSVSDISGRGVGVSSLFQAVDNAGGDAQMISEEGQSLKIVIKIPLRDSKQVLKLAA